jgi:FtsH-binding integral membrane protein
MAESSSDNSSTLPGAAADRTAVDHVDTDHADMGRVEADAIDAGLRAHMLHIYNYMALGLAVTAIAAMGVYFLSVTDDPAAAAKAVRSGTVNRLASHLYLTPTGYALFVSPVKWAIILAPLVLAFSLSFGIERMRPAVAQLLFWLYALLIGVSFGSVFMIYTHTSVGRVFFITATSFFALSLWGYTTRRDLSGAGSFLTMGLFGIIIAVTVNFFLASSALQWVISVMGVLVFSGLTAWDAQRLKNEYIYGAMDGETAERTAILGALSLYLDFINLFTLLLELSGQREE